MLRLETNDLSKAEQIIRHPAIVRVTGVPQTGPLHIVGEDRCTILIMDDEEPVGYIGFWFNGDAAECGAGVLPEYRGVEMRPLFEAAITAMFMIGRQKVTCSIPESNTAALSGARILGFSKEQTHRGVVHLAMTKQKWFSLHPQMRH